MPVVSPATIVLRGRKVVGGVAEGEALVTRETMLACQPSDNLRFASHGAFAVKGRTAEVELYEPIRKTT